MNKNDGLRFLSWLVPLLCCVLAVGVVGWQIRRLQVARAESSAVEKTVASLKRALEVSQYQDGSEKIPYAQDTRLEEAQFLDEVRQKAIANNVKLVRWTNEHVPVKKEDPSKPEDNIPEFAKDVRTLSSDVEVAGSFEGVRQFVQDLLGSSRLLSLKSGSWSRSLGTDENKFSFKLHRYVSSTPLPGSGVDTGTAGKAEGNQG